MALPAVPLSTSTLTIGGTDVTIHALTRTQALELNAYQGREDEAEDALIAWATDCSTEEAHAWRQAVSWDTAGQLVDAIIELSGLTQQPVPVPKR